MLVGSVAAAPSLGSALPRNVHLMRDAAQDSHPASHLSGIARSRNVRIEPEAHAPSLHIWIDADACPGAIKELVFRTSRRQHIPVCLVANRAMYIPPLSWVTFVRVTPEPDAADHYIVQHVRPYDLVIT